MKLQELIRLARKGTFDLPYEPNVLISEFYADIKQASGDHETVRLLCAQTR